MNPKMKEMESIIEKLQFDRQRDKERFEKEIFEQSMTLNSLNSQKFEYKSMFIAEKESEINQIRTEYSAILNEKNRVICEKGVEIDDLTDKNQELLKELKRLQENDKYSEMGLREHIESLKNLVDVKNKSIEKLEDEIQLMKSELQENQNIRNDYFKKIKDENNELQLMLNSEREQLQMELKAVERDKSYEVRRLELESNRLQKENQFLFAELNNKDTYPQNDRNTDEINRIYEECEKQTDFLENKLRESEKQLNNAINDINQLKNENKYIKKILDDRDKQIKILESRESNQKAFQKRQQYEPMAAEPSPTNQYIVENMNIKLSQLESENERLREQALQADREVDRLKENIILREREIHNVKKSIANKDTIPKDKAKQSDFALSIETNPNLVNEMARMSGSSGFKYGMKGPYDESLEKLRKEFSLQQKELGLDTLSEMSFDRHEEGHADHADKTYALLMGQNVRSPTGDLKVDYESLIEENEQLKLIVKEMRREMEIVVKKLSEVRTNEAMNSGSKFKQLDKKQNSGYLDSTNLRLHDLEQENEILKEEISRLKVYSKRDQEGGDKTIESFRKRLEEKKIIINKLKEERDNLLQLCSEMKIQINSMKKAQDLKEIYGTDKTDNADLKSRLANLSRNRSSIDINSSKTTNLGCFKSRLDNLGENVQELFSEFKAVLNQNKRGNIFSWKNLPFDGKKEVVVSGEKCNKLFEKFEKIQKDINTEQENISTNKMKKNRNSSKKSKKSTKSKSPIRGLSVKLAERNVSQNNLKKEFKRFNELKDESIY